jgi:hypothetical protein
MPLRFPTICLLWTLLLLPNGRNEAVKAFSGSSGEGIVKPSASLTSNAMWLRTLKRSSSCTRLFAKPERLQENMEGVVYVNDRVSLESRSMLYVCHQSIIVKSLLILDPSHCVHPSVINKDPHFFLSFILSFSFNFLLPAT